MQCNDAMLVSSDVSLRKLLNELTGHSIISTRSVNGVNLYFVALSESVIQNEIVKK